MIYRVVGKQTSFSEPYFAKVCINLSVFRVLWTHFYIKPNLIIALRLNIDIFFIFGSYKTSPFFAHLYLMSRISYSRFVVFLCMLSQRPLNTVNPYDNYEIVHKPIYA